MSMQMGTNAVYINYKIEVEDQTEKLKFMKRLRLPYVPNKEIESDVYSSADISRVEWSTKDDCFNVDINGFCDDHNEVNFAHSFMRLSKLVDWLESKGYKRVEV